MNMNMNINMKKYRNRLFVLKDSSHNETIFKQNLFDGMKWAVVTTWPVCKCYIMFARVAGVYFACVMIMCTISVTTTVVVLNFHHRSPEMYEMPGWVSRRLCVVFNMKLVITAWRGGVAYRNGGRNEGCEPPLIRRATAVCMRATENIALNC